MQLKPGNRLRSKVCGTEVVVIIVRDDRDVDLRCGGAAMTPVSDELVLEGRPAPALDGGTSVGKRYASVSRGVEVLVTKAGEGTLTIGDEVLTLKLAKALPSAD